MSVIVNGPLLAGACPSLIIDTPPPIAAPKAATPARAPTIPHGPIERFDANILAVATANDRTANTFWTTARDTIIPTSAPSNPFDSAIQLTIWPNASTTGNTITAISPIIAWNFSWARAIFSCTSNCSNYLYLGL